MSPAAATPGAPFWEFTIPDGQATTTFYVQGIDGASRVAYVWGLCEQGGLALKEALVGGASKAVGAFAADVACALIGAEGRNA